MTRRRWGKHKCYMTITYIALTIVFRSYETNIFKLKKKVIYNICLNKTILKTFTIIIIIIIIIFLSCKLKEILKNKKQNKTKKQQNKTTQKQTYTHIYMIAVIY